MGAKIRTKMAAAAKPNTEIPKLEAVPFPQPEEMPQMTEAGNDETRTKGGGGKTKPKKEEQNNDAPATSATCFVYEKITWKLNIEGCVPETIIYEAGSKIKETVTVKLGEEEPKIWKKLLPYNSLLYKSDGSNTGTISAQIVGKSKDGACHSYTEVFEIPNADKCYDLTVEVRWFGDGEKEFPIMINGKTDIKNAKRPYWNDAPNVAEKIKDETGSDFNTEDALFMDGNSSAQTEFFGLADKAMSAEFRSASGAADAKEQAPKIFAKLKKDPNTGKIVQRIQVFTHSRGSVYGNMFVAQLQDEIKKNAHLFADPDNVIDIVVHLDPHQPDHIIVQPSKHPTIVADHKNSVLGGIDGTAIDPVTGKKVGIKGDAYSMELADEHDKTTHLTGKKMPGYSHKLETYGEEIDKILDQHNKNGQNNTSDKYEGFKEVFKDQITNERPPTK